MIREYGSTGEGSDLEESDFGNLSPNYRSRSVEEKSVLAEEDDLPPLDAAASTSEFEYRLQRRVVKQLRGNI